MNRSSKIYVAGSGGLVGSALVRKLKNEGYCYLILKERKKLDLLKENEVKKFFQKEKPEYIFLAAAKVGGIIANNKYPANFIYENLQIQNNIIHNAYLSGVKKLLFLGSSCVYPKFAKQPIKENELLTGELEPTNKAYALAKIAGITMCQSYNKQYGANFISIMPTNLYGPNDNFDLETSHVIPALIRKFHEAKINNQKEVIIWGTGSPKREFLHIDDMADACLYLMNSYDKPDIINIGTGKDISIKELAKIIKEITNFKGKIIWDISKPDGAPRKLLNISKLNNLCWRYKINLKRGIKDTYEWYKNNNY